MPPTNTNPLLGFPGQTGVNQPMPPPQQQGTPQSPLPTTNPFQGAQTGQVSQNPYGQGTRGGGDQTFNLSQTNLLTGLLKNAAIPQYYQNMMSLAGPTAGYFQNLMNLGSPYYQQQQYQTFQNTNQQNQNAAALARQQLGAQGFGFTPSGANAAMIGGMAQGGAQSLSEQFLQNLFNNEQLQLAGAQGMGQLASMFNPAQLLTSQINPSIQQPTNTGAEWMQAASSLLPSGSYKLG